ncbi:hypothetical protein QE152_g28338 [Popillia japonica]|uniref:Uncharacterized protein n=1 Tax=Popillia japonica TaxID=7064 RepID=A0AAW1JJU3_POPJA
MNEFMMWVVCLKEMANLYLSHWNAEEKVCWRKKFDGAILSYEEGVNVPLAFQALWQALINANKVKLPFLIVVSDDNLVIWHYYLSQLGEVCILNSQNRKAVLQNTGFSIVLVPHSDIKLLQTFEENDYSFIVVENFDCVATTRLFKRLSGQFNIALTKQKFMVDRDYKKIWHILNWTNPGKFGKLNDFPQFDRDHIDNLCNPYDDIWFTYDFAVGEYDLDKDQEEKEKLEKILSDWAKKNGLPSRNSTEKPTRKRRLASARTAKGKRLPKKRSKQGNVD